MKRILFINNASSVSVIPELLEEAGFEVIEASNNAAGLRLLNSQVFNLTILQESPFRDCAVFCTELRRLTNAPFIVISSGASTENCVKAINAGADFFIRKPYGPLELLSRINALFQRVPVTQPSSLVSS